MPLLHGHAVAYGMLVELFLSSRQCGLSQESLHQFSDWILEVYGKFVIDKADDETLYELMGHDKKNEDKRINFTLIKAVGKFEINQHCGKNEIFEALDYFRMRNKS